MAVAGSGKCLLVTGPPGVGKTTLIIKVFESLKASNPTLKLRGFYTREIRQGSERVGFEVVTLDGRTAPLASSIFSSPDCFRWPTVGKYKVDIASFESLALPELQEIKKTTKKMQESNFTAALLQHCCSKITSGKQRLIWN